MKKLLATIALAISLENAIANCARRSFKAVPKRLGDEWDNPT